MSTITLAKIYERQGHFDDAVVIYRELLKNNPQNSEYKSALERLSSRNLKKVLFFTHMHTKEQYSKFERWLVKPWS